MVCSGRADPTNTVLGSSSPMELVVLHTDSVSELLVESSSSSLLEELSHCGTKKYKSVNSVKCISVDQSGLCHK